MKRLLALILFVGLSIAASAQTKIMILEMPSTGNDSNVHFVFWLYPPVGNQKYYRHPGAQPLGVPTAQEITDYQAGVFIQEEGYFQVPNGWTNAQTRTELQNRYTARDTTFQAEQAKWNRYGSTWAGVSGSEVWSTRVLAAPAPIDRNVQHLAPSKAPPKK